MGRPVLQAKKQSNANSGMVIVRNKGVMFILSLCKRKRDDWKVFSKKKGEKWKTDCLYKKKRKEALSRKKIGDGNIKTFQNW